MDTRQIATEAAEWLFKLEDDPRAETDPEFLAWLKRSPRHMGELLFATAALRLVQSGDPEGRIAIDESGAADSGEILPLKAQPDVLHGAVPRRRRWPAWTSAAAAVLA